MATYNDKDVSQVILAPDDAQPVGATGDDRIIMICFSDQSVPVNKTIAWLKKYSIGLGNNLNDLTNQKSEVDGVIFMASSL